MQMKQQRRYLQDDSEISTKYQDEQRTKHSIVNWTKYNEELTRKLQSKLNIRYAKNLTRRTRYADNEQLINQKTTLKARTRKEQTRRTQIKAWDSWRLHRRLRGKRFRLVSEKRKTEERDFRFWPREKQNKSHKMKQGRGRGGEGRECQQTNFENPPASERGV